MPLISFRLTKGSPTLHKNAKVLAHSSLLKETSMLRTFLLKIKPPVLRVYHRAGVLLEEHFPQALVVLVALAALLALGVAQLLPG